MIWLIGAGVVLLIGMLLWLSCGFLYIEVYYSRVKEDDQLRIEFKALKGLIRYQYHVTYLQFRNLWEGIVLKTGKTDSKQKLTFQRVKKWLQISRKLLANIVDATSWFRKTLAHVHCVDLRWRTLIGLGDAAETACAVGAIWGAKSMFSGYIFHHIVLDAVPNLSVQPQYHVRMFSTDFICKTKIRMGYLAYALLSLLIRLVKNNLNSLLKRVNVRLSYKQR